LGKNPFAIEINNNNKMVAEVDGLVFQQDGAPADFGAIVFTALNDFLVHGSAGEGRLIGPHGFLT
jgi:hypothetical protein